MNLLADTHILIWLIQDNPRLGPKAHGLLVDGDNAVIASYFSLLELKLKAVKSKLEFEPDIADDLAATQIDIAMPDMDDIGALTIHSPRNKDPFDNLLITIAIRKGWTLVTEDRRILELKIPGLSIISGRA